MLKGIHCVLTHHFGYLGHMRYEQRPKPLGLCPRRERHNLMQALKMANGLAELRGYREAILQKMRHKTLRGDGKTYVRERVTTESKSKSFTLRVVNGWRKRPMCGFKDRLDEACLVVFGRDSV